MKATTRFSQRGTFTLTALASVSGGILFTLLFANLVRYVSVENSLEQAVQKIARCIDPTDPACAIVTTTNTDQQYDWFTGQTREQTSTWVDRYAYTARVFRQNWELRFPGYEIHTVAAPPVEWTSWEIPQRDFRAELNRYERRSLEVSAVFLSQSERFRPNFVPNFPEFDRRYEDDRKNIDPWFWNARELNIENEARRADGEAYASHDALMPFQQWVSETREFGSTQNIRRWVELFVSDAVEVPALEIQNPSTVICEGESSSCTISDATGGNLPWQNYAYIAVKAFAQVARVSGSPEIKWAGSDWKESSTPDGYGLELQTLNRNTYQAWKATRDAAVLAGLPIPPPPPESAWDVKCLGGREWSDIRDAEGWKNFHLVLRGAIKRDPGTNKIDLDNGVDPACPHGDRKHWDLKVERGGAYRVRGWLTVRDGSVKARVAIQSYFDNYTKISSSEPLKCEGSIPLRPAQNLDGSACPYALACPELAGKLASGYALQSCSTTTKKQAVCTTPAQATADSSLFELPPVACQEQLRLPYCSQNEATPAASVCSSDLERNPGRQSCGWIEQAASAPTLSVVEQGFVCASAKTVPHSVPCGDGRMQVSFQPNGDYGDPRACPVALPALVVLGSNTAAISAIDSRFARKDPEVHWGEARDFQPVRWLPSVNPVDDRGRPIAGKDQVRPASVTIKNSKPIFQHATEGWLPELSAFGISSLEEETLKTRAYDLSPRESESLSLDFGYPFARQPEFEIPEYLASTHPGESCSGQAATLEQRLKDYATALLPAAAEPNIRIETSADYVDSVQTARSGGCDSSKISVSTPRCTRVSYISKSKEICGPGEYLGRYPSAEYPNGPAQCQARGVDCYSQAPVTAVEESIPKTTIDRESAKLEGYREIVRSFAGAKQDCDGPGCFSVDVQTDNEALTRITARYQMPLSFPLDALTGKTSMLVEKSKEELREISAFGRQRTQAPGEEGLR